MNVIRDKNKPIEIPEEVLIEALEKENLTKEERRKLKRQLAKARIRKVINRTKGGIYE